MSKTLVSKFLIAAPLAVVAVLAVAFAWGYSFSNDARAADPVNGQMVLTVKNNTVACPPASSADFCVVKGTDFLLSADLIKINDVDYVGIQTEIDYGALVYKPTANATDEIVWPDDALPLRSPGAPTGLEGLVNHASSTAATPPFPASTFVGNLVELTMNCSAGDSSNVIDLVPLDPGNTNGSGLKPTSGADIPQSDSITVDCIQAPTNTPLPPTDTPPDFPQMQKLPALQNLWLTRDDPSDPKIPPTICSDDEDVATLTEQLSIPIPVIPDPKDPSIDQELGAFEFEIHFDDTKVCVNIVAATGAGEAAENMICVVEDKDSSTLEGVARIGCVTQGKTNFPDTDTPEGRILARIEVRPQPDVYSQAKPNQDNGVVVQLNNVLCELADLQGHPIPVFSCEDADVTIRYLEGDVEPDCVINALDTQAIAFRWGVEKGSLIYTEFMNLEPSGPQADDDIDIKDLQFVFGRFGSDCTAPHPTQDPVNPKA